MDVIARCAFGMTIQNLGGKDDPFMEKAMKVFSPPVNKSPIIIIPCKSSRIHSSKIYFNLLNISLLVIFPRLMAYFGERLFFTEEFVFFINVLKDLINQRANSNDEVSSSQQRFYSLT